MSPITNIEAALRMLLMARRAVNDLSDGPMTKETRQRFAQEAIRCGRQLKTLLPLDAALWFETDGCLVKISRLNPPEKIDA